MQKLEIPSQCFKYKSSDEQISTEQQQATPVTKFTWNKEGILMYLHGAEYPMRGLTSPETMWALNLAKRVFIEAFRFLSKWYFFPTYLILALMPWKAKKKVLEQFIHSYTEVTWRNLSPFILKTDYLSPVGKEIEWITYSFLNNLDIKPDLCGKFSEVFSALIDYDTAYRYRVEDIFSETTKAQLMENPVKEIIRLLKILEQRDARCVYNKFKVVVLALRIALIFPKFRKAFKIAISEIDVRKMGLDEGDRYWVCLRNDEYKFLGKTMKERDELIKGKSKPPLVDIL